MLWVSSVPYAEKLTQCYEMRERPPSREFVPGCSISWNSFTKEFCSSERGKGFVECLAGSGLTPWNTSVWNRSFSGKPKKSVLKRSLIQTDGNADTHECESVFLGLARLGEEQHWLHGSCLTDCSLQVLQTATENPTISTTVHMLLP